MLCKTIFRFNLGLKHKRFSCHRAQTRVSLQTAAAAWWSFQGDYGRTPALTPAPPITASVKTLQRKWSHGTASPTERSRSLSQPRDLTTVSLRRQFEARPCEGAVGPVLQQVQLEQNLVGEHVQAHGALVWDASAPFASPSSTNVHCCPICEETEAPSFLLSRSGRAP